MVDAAAPLERMPLYVRAGSILPLGPDMEWSDEKPADPIELRVYTGADGDFTLYEDAGDSYDYERGQRATIAFHWDDKSGTLTIGAREGSFPGMLAQRSFHVVFIAPDRAVGAGPSSRADHVVAYRGEAVTVRR
jgi:alpha-D-xyloside xylohydrolase